jgi:hypothetical protein
MPRTLADVTIWWPWGTPWIEITDSDAYPPSARVNVSNAELSDKLRKVTLNFDRVVGTTVVDDRMLTGIHLLNEGGEWNAAGFEACEAALDAFWNAVKPHYMPETRLVEYAWHRAGPAYDSPNSPGPAVRRNPRLVSGTAGGTFVQLPHQVAVTVTERTMVRKRWGRLFLPAPSSNVVMSGGGRLTTGFLGVVADALADAYSAMLAEDIVPVVYSPAQPSRTRRSGATLPAKPAGALKVNTLQVDNVPDVIRSRRLKAVTARERRGAAIS